MDILQKMGKFTVVTALLIVSIFIGILLAQQKEESGIGIGERFHKETSFALRGVMSDMFRAEPKQPPEYKAYPDAAKIVLPKPEYTGITVEQAIKQRRSVRHYSQKPLTKEQLSQLLFAAQGITAKTYGKPLRAAPSAGALYPFEIYIIANNVQDLPKGIYHYSVLEHNLEMVKSGDFRRQISNAGLDQRMLGDAGATFVLSAIFDRVCYKYGERGYRYVYIEAGHISQSIYLQAVSLGLGSVCVGAFSDEKVNKLIDVDGVKEAVIYLHSVGSL
jgi:SagB-type dehydrogenase family enzyme